MAAPYLALAVLARACLFPLPHDSGQGASDKFGDFEAHRTWLATTTSQPLRAWYSHELQYWGLDYPPLFAYFSLALGLLAARAAPQLLRGGRGYCSAAATLRACAPAKLFMRASVLLADAPLLAAAELLRGQLHAPPQALLLLLLHPAQLAIDHGHFQYNGGAVGLALAAAAIAAARAPRGTGGGGGGGGATRPLLAAALFTLALNFKHTAVYYAPVLLVLLLAQCAQGFAWWRGGSGGSGGSGGIGGSCSPWPFLGRVAAVGACVAGVMAALWLPFCLASTGDAAAAAGAGQAGSCLGGLGAVAARLAPLDRGLFEDVVANAWYATESATRLQRDYFPPRHDGTPVSAGYRAMALACTALAVAGALPSLLLLWRAAWLPDSGSGSGASAARAGPAAPTLTHHVLLALHNCALSFFLLSFHVHEKAILFAALPLALLAPALPHKAREFAVLSVWSMGTLLARDGLLAVAAALCLLHFFCSRLVPGSSSSSSSSSSGRGEGGEGLARGRPWVRACRAWAWPACAAGLAAVAACSAAWTPPARYQYLFHKLTAVLCAGAFAGHLVWGTLAQAQWVREWEAAARAGGGGGAPALPGSAARRRQQRSGSSSGAQRRRAAQAQKTVGSE